MSEQSVSSDVLAVKKAIAAARRSKHEKENWPRIYARIKAYRANNAEKFKQQRAASYQRRKKKHLAYSKKWDAEHPEKRKAITDRYVKSHLANFVLQSLKRRIRINRSIVGNQKEIADFYRLVATADKIKCYWCKKNIPKGNRKRQVDHVRPLSKGGAHALYNLVPSCPKCNHKKNAKLPEEFSGQHFIDFLGPNNGNNPTPDSRTSQSQSQLELFG